MTSRADFINQQILLTDGVYAGVSIPKHRKMSLSPFLFFRGSAQLFYADLSVNNLPSPQGFEDTPLTTIMGDCHTSNFGFFTEEGSHGETIVFSLNDFDDACIGYAHWDLLRYLVSLVLALDHGRGLRAGEYESEKDFSEKLLVDHSQLTLAMNDFIDSYASILEKVTTCSPSHSCILDEVFADFTTASPLRKRYKKAQRIALGGEHFLTNSALAKAVDLKHFPLKFYDDKGKYTREGIDMTAICNQLAPYFFDTILDVVKRENAGTGSVNMQRLYLLIGPKNISDASQIPRCHVVEVKQQRSAAPIYYFADLHHQNRLNPAHLTVKCQRSMQRKSDYCLDEAFFQDAHYLVRSRHHAKVGIDPEHITLGKVNALQSGFAFYASACGQALARAHCRGVKSTHTFEHSFLQFLNKNKSELISLAFNYAEQVMTDWKWFCKQR